MAIDFTTADPEALQRRRAIRNDPVQRYRRLVEIRAAEARIREFHSSGQAWGTTHCADGQEAVAVGLAAAAPPTDLFWVAHRVHAMGLALGCTLESVFAENLGRTTGSVGGIGGSFHLTDVGVGLIHSFTIIGTQIAQAVGGAFASQVLGSDRVTVAVFGDGAVNIGVFHEALNLAALWKAPVVFILENNHYAEFTHVDTVTTVTPLARRADSYGIPWRVVDGQDVESVTSATTAALDHARHGGGPTLVEMSTYRYLGHSRSDPAAYRPEGEADAWHERDPIKVEAARLLSEGLATDDDLSAVDELVASDIAEAAEIAYSAPNPPLSAMFTNVWAPDPPSGGSAGSVR